MEIKPVSEVNNPSIENNSFDPDKRVDINKKQDFQKMEDYNPDKRVEVNKKQDVKKDTVIDADNRIDVRNEVKIPEGGSYSEVKKHSNGDTEEVNHMFI